MFCNRLLGVFRNKNGLLSGSSVKTLECPDEGASPSGAPSSSCLHVLAEFTLQMHPLSVLKSMRAIFGWPPLLFL